MGEVTGRLTVFFEGPFWVGIFERQENGKLSAAKVTFGPEPKDYQVYDFVLKYYDDLQFSPTVDAAETCRKKNPKRVQREVQKQLENSGAGTKSQQALKLQYEQCKAQREKQSRQEKEAEKQRKFALRQQKKKEKHRGR